MNTFYTGEDLLKFQHATNWKAYFSAFFKPYLQGSVAEVGAGLGTNVPYLLNDSVKHYLCIEPDKKLAAEIQRKIDSGMLPKTCAVQQGYLEDDLQETFDALLYIDVLEHIENDAAEVAKAAKALKTGGYLCVLVPANPKDYTAFDKAIGHFRRYNKEMLVDIVKPPLQLQRCHYLDLFGSLASKTNKLFLKQSRPGKTQVLLWDRLLVPASRLLDKPIGYRYGKSLLLVARKSK
jgi:SAM-dependent methyltransferase